MQQMAGRALRTLAFAEKTNLGQLSNYDGTPNHPMHKELNPDNFSNIEQDMTFVGMVGRNDLEEVMPEFQISRDLL
jgi:P-type Ca2+ transporter type 2C